MRLRSQLQRAGLVPLLFAIAFAGASFPMPVAGAVGPQYLPVTESGSTLHLPYWANGSVSAGTQQRAVIVVHGSSRNASGYFDYARSAATAAGDSITLVVAPHFATADDIRAQGLPDSTIYWSSGGWSHGSMSRDDDFARPFRLSSYSVLDRLILQLADRSRFPNNRHVVVIGHSAGGQLAQRHATTSRVEQQLPSGTTLQYVAANPGSYVYMDPARAMANGSFAAPTSQQRAACPAYNDWKHGLDSLITYPKAVGSAQIAAQYGSRYIAYLLGDQDTDPNAADLDTGCEASWQGVHRFERGQTYLRHLAHYYGPSVLQRHVLHVVAGVGHSGSKMIGSPAARTYMFGVPSASSPSRSQLAQDGFARTAQGGWGSADIGGRWTSTGGSLSEYRVADGAAEQRHAKAKALHHSYFTELAALDTNMTVRVRIPALGSSGSVRLHLLGRLSDAANYWRGEMRVSAKGAASVALASVVSGSVTTRATKSMSEPYRAGAWWQVRFRVSGVNGTTVQVKAWLDGTPEPGWQLSGTFNVAALDRATGAGLASSTDSLVGTLQLTVQFDDLAVQPVH